MSYQTTFCEWGDIRQKRQRGHGRLNILFLYDPTVTHITTVYDHLGCFAWFSKHNIYYSSGVCGAPLNFPLELFDVVVIHYSVRLCFDYHISPEFREGVSKFRGLKALFIQDEYENTWFATEMMNSLGVDVVFSAVPERYIPKIYSRARRCTEFFQVLTGYLPLDYETFPSKPIAERQIAIGYRGRALHYRFGRMSREKYTIGVEVKRLCQERGVSCDIEWAENKRIYGHAWLEFLANCRATLGAESGSNVFDFDGTLFPIAIEALAQEPDLTFDEFHERFIGDRESEPIMNQISPRVFEAIAVRSALVLFEGSYSGIVQPDEHYIPLKKDFSNIDDVLSKVADDAFIEKLTERAYNDVVGSEKYTYQEFVRFVESILEPRVKNSGRHELIANVMACRAGDQTALFPSAQISTKPVWYEDSPVLFAVDKYFEEKRKREEDAAKALASMQREEKPWRVPFRVEPVSLSCAQYVEYWDLAVEQMFQPGYHIDCTSQAPTPIESYAPALHCGSLWDFDIDPDAVSDLAILEKFKARVRKDYISLPWTHSFFECSSTIDKIVEDALDFGIREILSVTLRKAVFQERPFPNKRIEPVQSGVCVYWSRGQSIGINAIRNAEPNGAAYVWLRPHGFDEPQIQIGAHFGLNEEWEPLNIYRRADDRHYFFSRAPWHFMLSAKVRDSVTNGAELAFTSGKTEY